MHASHVLPADSSQLSHTPVEKSSPPPDVDQTSITGIDTASSLSLSLLSAAAYTSSQALVSNLPNRCSYDGCGAPFHVEPELCTMLDCGGLVNSKCQLFALEPVGDNSHLLCSGYLQSSAD